jgi:hypothetical protein
MAFRGENRRSFGYDLKNGGPVSQQVWHIKEPSLLKAVSAKHRSKFAALSDSHQIAENCLCGSKTIKKNKSTYQYSAKEYSEFPSFYY